MRTALKVATVFTGAAAWAAMFASGAEAATTARAQPMTPDTGHKNCAIGPKTTGRLQAAGHLPPGPTCVGGLPNKKCSYEPGRA
jgi:hypothetical protein